MPMPVIGVMGPGEDATASDCQTAYALGRQIAQAGWLLLSGGRACGVMEAASQGAKSAEGWTIGILPGDDRRGMCEAIDIAIITGMGSARNNINVLSSDVVIACGSGAGTVSEIALALKAKKPVILLNASLDSQRFFQSVSPAIRVATDVAEAIALVRQFLAKND